LILIGSFPTARWWTVVAATGVILAALYLLWAYQRVFHGEADEANRGFPEIRAREVAVLAPFIVAIVFTGIYPKPILERIEPAVVSLVQHVESRSGFTEPIPGSVGSGAQPIDSGARGISAIVAGTSHQEGN